jgi:hypothetical protein
MDLCMALIEVEQRVGPESRNQESRLIFYFYHRCASDETGGDLNAHSSRECCDEWCTDFLACLHRFDEVFVTVL